MTESLKTSWDGHFMQGGFLSCLHWALGHEPTLAAYRAATGDNWRPPASPSERMIDQATGADLAFLQRFSDWVELNVFGRPQDMEGDAA